jgi:hypothetical protein
MPVIAIIEKIPDKTFNLYFVQVREKAFDAINE